jgi:hypothetical protein
VFSGMVMILSGAAEPSAPPLRSDHEINSHKVPDTPDRHRQDFS